MKHLINAFIVLISITQIAVGQAKETASLIHRHEFTVQGGAVLTRKVTDSGVTYKPTSAGMGLVGYRFNINRWIGLEGDYNIFRNSQKFTEDSVQERLMTNVNVVTGAVVINIPNPITKRIRSFITVGGGEMFFSPAGADFAGTKRGSVIAFGGGIDYPLSCHLAIRGQGNTLMYKAPNFGLSSVRVSKYSQTLAPSAGLVFSF